MVPIVVGCILLYAVFDGLSAGVVEEQRLAFGLVLVSAVTGLLALPRRYVVSPFSSRLTVLWALLIGAGFLGVARQPIIYPTYVMGDAAAIALPLVLLVYGRADPKLFGARVLHWVTISTLVIACSSLFFIDEAGRYEPPHPLLMATLWVWAVFPGRLSTRLAAAAGIVIITALALGSGFRTHAILVVFAGAAALLLRAFSRRKVIPLVAIISVLTLFAVVSGLHVTVYGMLLDTRFGPMLLYGLDQSSVNRFFEVQDVLHVISNEWSLWSFPVGAGHGATFEPSFSYSDRNLTEHNRIHNIHIGPALLLFRYGLLGAALWVGLMITTLVGFRRTRERMSELRDPRTTSAFSVAGLLVLVEFLQFNSIVNPLSAFAVAGALVWTYGLRRGSSARDREAPR